MVKKEPRVAIIGGGLSGITMAIELRKKLKIESFTIYEKMGEPGGTWRDNTYPGCACDVPSHWYSLSSEQNPYWTAKYSPQPEIQAYWKNIHAKHKLAQKTKYNSTFDNAVWNKQRQLYEITFYRTTDKDVKFKVEAEVLISAIGGFSTPLEAPPSLPGLLDFKGERFHSARWNHDVDLRNKTVGVIGNGCSGAQFIPVISEETSTKVINFSRTPSWFYPRDQRDYSAVTKWAFAHIPFVMNFYRSCMAFALDSRFPNWLLSMASIRHFAEEVAVNHIRKSAPEKYHEFLIPTYPFGCKRIILDPGYLDSLNRPNVELITDRIETITERGIKGKSGEEYPLDVLILATGFDVTARGLGINVRGSHGRTVTEQWEAQGGPQAYLGTAIAGMPNFYTILGPNVATGHASVISSTESQCHYIAEMVRPLVYSGVKSLEIKSDAEERYNRNLRRRLGNTVWSACDSYYKLPNGKIVATFPGTLSEFWWRTRKPNFEHYLQKGGRSLAMRDRLYGFFRLALFIVAVLGLRRYGVKKLRNEALMFGLMRYQDVMGLIRRD